jgi:PAS domain S-box-containing protein
VVSAVTDNLLDLFLSTTEDYGIILLDPQGLIQRWSRGAERLFGYAPHEVEGTLAHQIFVPPDRQAGVPEVELRLAAEQGRAEDER